MAKKIPERKCMGCNAKKPKNELIRVVRSPEGTVDADVKGKMPGRGVYICCERKCFERVKKSGRLAVALETEIPVSVYDTVEALIAETEEKSDG